MLKEQALPEEFMAEVIQMMLSEEKLNSMLSEASIQGAHLLNDDYASEVKDIRTALKARQA